MPWIPGNLPDNDLDDQFHKEVTAIMRNHEKLVTWLLKITISLFFLGFVFGFARCVYFQQCKASSMSALTIAMLLAICSFWLVDRSEKEIDLQTDQKRRK